MLPCPIRAAFVSLLTNKSISTTTNQKVGFRPISTVLFGSIKLQIWILYLHKNEPIRDQGEHVLHISEPPFSIGRVHFWFPLEACIPGLQSLHLNEVSPLLHPRLETSYWNWINGSNLLLTQLRLKEILS